MKKLLTVLVLIITLNSYSQQCRKDIGSEMSVSFYSSLDNSKGFEVRGQFDNFYMGMQVESFVFDNKDHLNWGGSLGYMKHFDYYSTYLGIRGGFVQLESSMKPSFGLEGEINLNLFNNIFVGPRVTYDLYMDSTLEQINSINYSRFFLKIGYTF